MSNDLSIGRIHRLRPTVCIMNSAPKNIEGDGGVQKYTVPNKKSIGVQGGKVLINLVPAGSDLYGTPTQSLEMPIDVAKQVADSIGQTGKAILRDNGETVGEIEVDPRWRGDFINAVLRAIDFLQNR